MRRRSEIGSIASGMVHSFVSRNNDLGGYWGIGVNVALMNWLICGMTGYFHWRVPVFHRKRLRRKMLPQFVALTMPWMHLPRPRRLQFPTRRRL